MLGVRLKDENDRDRLAKFECLLDVERLILTEQTI